MGLLNDNLDSGFYYNVYYSVKADLIFKLLWNESICVHLEQKRGKGNN